MKPKTRIGKIARLPLEAREHLNRRLQNGEMGGPILKWLNELPETIKVLAELFNSQPINKQNLSDWRHGGYQDWLNHQDREKWISRVCEQGDQLEVAEGTADLYDCFSRILIAEMAEDLESLHGMTDRAQRSKRIHLIARDLCRLQNSFNHSKRVELEWVKRNDLYEDEDSGTDILPVRIDPPGQDARATTDVTANAQPQNQNVNPSQAESMGAPADSVKPPPPPQPKIENVIRNIYHRQCGYGCVCKNCHPDDGPYPYAQAVKDDEAHEQMDSDYWLRGNEHWLVFHTDCDCYCGCEKSLAWERRHPGSAGVSPATL
jgi:hypothetical protein